MIRRRLSLAAGTVIAFASRVTRFSCPRAAKRSMSNPAEAAVLSLRSRFALQSIFFDPWQGIALSQRLTRAGVSMIEWPQTLGNLSLMAGNLLELIKRQQIVCYPSDDLRQAIAKTVAIESARGWRLGKAKQSDRVDPVIALAMGALACVQAGRVEPMDASLQAQLHEAVVAARRARDGVVEGDRLFANGADLARTEDGADAIPLRRRSGSRGSRWAGW